jgi:hypothetical protein
MPRSRSGRGVEASVRSIIGNAGIVCALLGACSSQGQSGFPTSPDGSAPGSGSGSMFHAYGGMDASSPTLGGQDGAPTAVDASACNATDPNGDMDKDGWTPAQGDCNDCDPNINPGAIDVFHATGDGGAGYWGDEDCSGTAGDSAKPCDQGLALADVDANDAAKAIELCKTATMTNREYGVISAAYVRADGTPFASPGVQVGIQSGFGPNVHVQGGANMLALSSGAARTVGQPGACGTISCEYNATATAPTGFPEDDPDCPPTKLIADDVALEVQVRVPSNATGYSFSFKFHSFEYPDWVCDPAGYNDQFIALVTPPPTGAYVPTGSTGGNISFDSNKHPVSVNIGYFDVCDPTTPTRFASHCTTGAGITCPPVPSPYCPLGVGELASTGFDVWNKDGPDGATRWLQTQAPATPGSIITIRFAIWDAGNGEYDSTVLLDDVQWNATGGTVTVGTAPVPSPK